MVSNNKNSSDDAKRKVKTIWVRSNPIDETKQFKESYTELDLSNIITGTRRRKNVDYRKCHLTGAKIEVKRSSINSLEKRSTKGINKQNKTKRQSKH